MRRDKERITEARQASTRWCRTSSNPSKKDIMQARQIIAATLLAVGAVGAMAQEIDRSETLQARNIAGAQAATSQRSRESVRAETRNLQAQGKLGVAGENSAAPVADSAPDAAPVGLTRAQVKADLAQWRASHKMSFGEQG